MNPNDDEEARRDRITKVSRMVGAALEQAAVPHDVGVLVLVTEINSPHRRTYKSLLLLNIDDSSVPSALQSMLEQSLRMQGPPQ